jgi:hypothetical protein
MTAGICGLWPSGSREEEPKRQKRLDKGRVLVRLIV